jgi:agmatine deiminase
MRAKFTILAYFIFTINTVVFAQNSPENRYFDEIKGQISPISELAPPPAGIITTPPPYSVRTMAEWEELSGLMIAWTTHPDILAEIVRAAREETEVIIACRDAATVTSCKSKLTAKGVDFSTKVTFLIVSYNSIWSRDYGPNSVYKNDVDSLLIVDWKYNRPTRPLDDALPCQIADFLGVPCFSSTVSPTDLCNTGGNFMTDGMGTAFASKLILTENATGNMNGVSVKTEAQINQILTDFMGISRFPKMETLPFDEIHHIDMHMKLLDEETILMSEYPEGVADGPQIEANLQYILSNWTTPFGDPYKVVRVPSPPDAQGEYPNSQSGDYRTYANAVFVNKTVILPTYEQQYDSTAIKIWQKALPGYKIFGVNCNAVITSLGAIHCITKEIGATEPILITHKRQSDCKNLADSAPYQILANIKTRSGVENANVFYSQTPEIATSWQSVPMYLVGQDSFLTEIAMPTDPQFFKRTYYYIEATANSGKKMTRPMPGAAGGYFFDYCTISTEKTPILYELKPIFPNPASAITCVPVFSSSKMNAQIELFDLTGRQIQTIFSGNLAAGESKFFVDAAKLSSGIYFVRMVGNGQVLTQKLVVK